MKKFLSFIMALCLICTLLPAGILTTQAEAAAYTGTFEKYSGTITEGYYLITYDNYAMQATISSKRFANGTITKGAASITDPDASIVWKVEQNGSYWTLYNESTSKYAAGNGTKNNGALIASVTDYAKWTVTGSSTYEFVNLGNANKGVNKNLRNNSTYGFACYATSTGGALTLYKLVEATEPGCDHTGATYVQEVAADCTTEGKKAHYECSCGLLDADKNPVTEDALVIEALGHSYGTDGICTGCGQTKPNGYVAVTDVSTLKSDDVVIITMTKGGVVYAMTNDKGTTNPPIPVQVTVTDGTIDAEKVADNIKWNVSYSGGNLTIYPNGTTATWLYCTNTNNGVRVGTEANNTFTVSGNYLQNSGTKRFVGIYNTQDWRCYTSTTTNIANQTLTFYKLETSTPSEPSDPSCQHTDAEKIDAKEATCAESGWYAHYLCDCGQYLDENKNEVEYESLVIAVVDHAYGTLVAEDAADCTKSGLKAHYQCAECGKYFDENKSEVTYESLIIPITGHNYKDGECTECGTPDPFAGLPGRYYIAASRDSEGKSYYMTSDLGTATTKRYQAAVVDGDLPEVITDPEDGYVFVLINNGDGTFSIQAEGMEGNNYLSWSSGNSGAFAAADGVNTMFVPLINDDGTYSFKLESAGRYLSLNSTKDNNYFAWYTGTQTHNLTLIPVEESAVVEFYPADGSEVIEYTSWEKAMDALKDVDAGELVLLEAMVLDEVSLPTNLVLNLNGCTLTVGYIAATVIDTGDGDGIIEVAADQAVLKTVDEQIILWDNTTNASGYRVFYYEFINMEIDADGTDAEQSAISGGQVVSFWSDVIFTNDRAYTLIASEVSGLHVSFKLALDDGSSKIFELSDETVAAWADAQAEEPYENYCFYIAVFGFESLEECYELTATPIINFAGDNTVEADATVCPIA